MSEWIEWKGGECPVPPGTPTWVLYRSGHGTFERMPELTYWHHANKSLDVMYYMVGEPALAPAKAVKS